MRAVRGHRAGSAAPEGMAGEFAAGAFRGVLRRTARPRPRDTSASLPCARMRAADLLLCAAAAVAEAAAGIDTEYRHVFLFFCCPYIQTFYLNLRQVQYF